MEVAIVGIVRSDYAVSAASYDTRVQRDLQHQMNRNDAVRARGNCMTLSLPLKGRVEGLNLLALYVARASKWLRSPETVRN